MTALTRLSTDAVATPTVALSQGVAADGIVFTSGQVGSTSDGRFADTLVEQIHLALDNVEAVLAAAGCGLRDVIKTTCFLSEVADFRAFDAAYRARFGADLPARSTVGVAFADPRILVEIEAVAVRPSA